jgi:hypothetical protein
MVAALGSCEQNQDEITLKKDNSESGIELPPPSLSVAPVIITGANNGGNAPCAEVAQAFGCPAGYTIF